MSAPDWLFASPAPTDATIIWRIEVPLGAAIDPSLLSRLSQEERIRADRLYLADDRDRFVVTHAAKRKLLAALLETPAVDLDFETAANGKPHLAGCWRGRLHFNLSHSGQCTLIAISPQSDIGVDVEVIRPLPDWSQIARAHFSQREIGALTLLPDSQALAAFFACWTRKEAVTKTIGAGLTMRLDRFSVAIPPDAAALIEIDGDQAVSRTWSMCHLEPLARHVGCAATNATDTAFKLQALSEQWLFGSE